MANRDALPDVPCWVDMSMSNTVGGRWVSKVLEIGANIHWWAPDVQQVGS